MVTPDPSARRLRVGIVGGGQGSFIGRVHRMALELDGQAQVIAGAMSSNPATARASAAAWHLTRSYDDYLQMARDEAKLSDAIDLAIVATPNHLHFDVVSAFLNQGIAVVCDKPMTTTVEQARQLVELVARSGRLFAVTYNYSGYQAIREARALIARGELGEIRKVVVEYHQDWLMSAAETDGNKQASWRTDPRQAGAGGAIGDIGSHAHHLLEYVTGQKIQSVCADLTSFVAGRELDDDANVLLRLEGGARGTLSCSQIACGEENRLTLRVYGTQAGLEWSQENASTLLFKPEGRPWQRLRAGADYLSAEARAAGWLPAGHPEGYIEAFGALYRDIIADQRRALRGEPLHANYPSVGDGLRGVVFINACVESSRRGTEWQSLS